jgi:hypothetical protein
MLGLTSHVDKVKREKLVDDTGFHKIKPSQQENYEQYLVFCLEIILNMGMTLQQKGGRATSVFAGTLMSPRNVAKRQKSAEVAKKSR